MSPGATRRELGVQPVRKRRWGQIPDAITAALAEAGEMRVVEIHAAAEALLGPGRSTQ